MKADDREVIMDAIEQQRALNNKIFMRAWRLLAERCPKEFNEIQSELRAGDLRIYELNGELCREDSDDSDPKCECGLTAAGRCPVCLTLPR
jgi:hypothetical protein